MMATQLCSILGLQRGRGRKRWRGCKKYENDEAFNNAWVYLMSNSSGDEDGYPFLLCVSLV